MIDIEDYKDSEGVVDYDSFNADLRKMRGENYDNAMATFEEARRLATLNNFSLQQHSSPWHFSLDYFKNGQRRWRINLYPSNQRLYADRNCGKAPFLEVEKPWTFLDVVSVAIIVVQEPPEKLVKALQ